MVMLYLLDTNIVIFILKNPACRAATRLQQEDAEEITSCAVVDAELYHGATKYGVPLRRKELIEGFMEPYASLPFDSACVPHYARIRDQLERAGHIIGGNDLMIAAIALANDLTVVTHNSAEFSRVSGLRVEDWSL